MAKPLIIENGQKFNNLTVLKEVEKSKKLKINSSTLNKRLKNWSLEKDLTTPKSEKNDTSCFRNR